tara:strand:- start:55 stop:987 length:933 start_codon:yes stop_codon:yes gene_type:complete
MADLFQSGNIQQNTDGGSLTLEQRNQFSSQRPGLLTDKHDNTIKNIKDLQELEKYMFQNLQSLNKNSTGSIQETDIIKNRIGELSSMRVALFNQLKSMYKDQQTQTASSRSNLADQLTMTSVIDNELTNAQSQLDVLEKEYSNKKRLVELSEYEYDRYSSHKNMMKITVYGALGVLAIVYLMSFPWFPASVGMLSICIIIAIVLISISGRMLTNLTRTGLSWNKFTFDKNLPPDDMSGEKKTKGWWNLFATSCENIRDTAYATGALAAGALENETSMYEKKKDELSSPIESFTSYVEDSDPKNAEAFFNI